MDSLDKLILQVLSNNCRISYSELARKAKVSPNTIKNRIQNLINQKIILGFTIQFNPALLKFSTAIISFQFSNQISEETINRIGNYSLVSAVGVSLNSGFVVALYQSNEELAQFSDHLHSLGNLTDLEILPILLPLTVDTTKPKDRLESLQPIDWLLLYHLRVNGRMSLSKLAKKTHLSVKTIKKRLNSLNKRKMIHTTILMNPGAISKGLMVIFVLELPKITREVRHSIEKMIRNVHEDNFWVSWQVVDRPIILIGFQVANVHEVKIIQEDILKLIPECVMRKHMIGGDMKYFPDVTDQLLEDKRNQGWFSSELWERELNS
ncbi:MAG: Lrp/AsnC family transcriptional regulator [Promethearchaeota archaeon]